MGSFSCELYAYLYRFAGMHTDLDIALGKISLILANLGYTLTRFCFSAKPDSALSQLKPQINISLRIRVYPGAAILLNWEDKRAQSACKRANCQQDVTWNNYVKDTTSCTDRRLITATSGDMIELPELDHVYRFGDYMPKSEEESLLAYKFNSWKIKCLKDPNVKLGNRCKDDIATFEISLNYVDDTERWYFFSIGSCRRVI